jgi:hypothetical protein
MTWNKINKELLKFSICAHCKGDGIQDRYHYETCQSCLGHGILLFDCHEDFPACGLCGHNIKGPSAKINDNVYIDLACATLYQFSGLGRVNPFQIDKGHANDKAYKRSKERKDLQDKVELESDITTYVDNEDDTKSWVKIRHRVTGIWEEEQWINKYKDSTGQWRDVPNNMPYAQGTALRRLTQTLAEKNYK